MSRLTQYIKDTRAEMRHVNWPTRSQAIGYTLVVIAISLAIAAYLGFLDWLFQVLIQRFFV
jgi:preprotein translocase subunit SecE